MVSSLLFLALAISVSSKRPSFSVRKVGLWDDIGQSEYQSQLATLDENKAPAPQAERCR